MRTSVLLVIFALFTSMLFSQDKPAYTVFNSKGEKVSYSEMVKALSKSDIILFGELHNDPIAHWLQLELTKDLHQSKKLILGAEMFEADNQDELKAYLLGEIDNKSLDSLARLWTNYKTDYAPLVDYAKENNLPFIATNIPRRFANKVYRHGFEALDSLSAEEKSWVAPLPIAFDAELPEYKKILKMMGDHGSLNLVKAQAIKDATMAYFILQNYKEEHLFLHFNGAYHSNNYEGILWYLKQTRSNLRYGTISTVLQENLNQLEDLGIADFIICVDSDMTRTY